MSFLIAYHTQTIYKSIYIENILSDIDFKASKIHLKIGLSFWGQYTSPSNPHDISHDSKDEKR